MSASRENLLNQAIIPAETVEFPSLESLGVELKNEPQVLKVEHLSPDVYAKFYWFGAPALGQIPGDGLYYIHLYNFRNKQSNVMTIVSSYWHLLSCNNSLCPDYFAIDIGGRQLAIYGPNSTTLKMIVPALPESLRLGFCSLQMLPDAKGIVACDRKSLMTIDLTAQKPTWKTINSNGFAANFTVIDENTIGLTAFKLRWLQPHPSRIYYTKRDHFTFYNFDLKNSSLKKIKESNVMDDFNLPTSKFFSSPSKKYFGKLDLQNNNFYRISLYRINIQNGQFELLTNAINSKQIRPIFTTNDLLFYNEHNINQPNSNRVCYYDLAQNQHFSTESSGEIFSASPFSFVTNENGVLQTYDYKVCYKSIESAKTELMNQQVPETVVDIMLEFGFSMFSHYKRSQNTLQQAGKKLDREIMEIARELDQQETSAANNYQALNTQWQELVAEQDNLLNQAESKDDIYISTINLGLTQKWEQLVTDRNALNHFLFLSKQLQEDSPAGIYEKVLQEFPTVSEEIKELFQDHLHMLLAADYSFKK